MSLKTHKGCGIHPKTKAPQRLANLLVFLLVKLYVKSFETVTATERLLKVLSYACQAVKLFSREICTTLAFHWNSEIQLLIQWLQRANLKSSLQSAAGYMFWMASMFLRSSWYIAPLMMRPHQATSFVKHTLFLLICASYLWRWLRKTLVNHCIVSFKVPYR